MQQPTEKPLIAAILLILLIMICSLESFLILTERVSVTTNSEMRLFFNNTQGPPNVYNESFVFATNNTEECRNITTYIRVSMMVP